MRERIALDIVAFDDELRRARRQGVGDVHWDVARHALT